MNRIRLPVLAVATSLVSLSLLASSGPSGSPGGIDPACTADDVCGQENVDRNL